MSTAVPIPENATFVSVCNACKHLVFFDGSSVTYGNVRFEWSEPGRRYTCKGVKCPSCSKFVPYMQNLGDRRFPQTMDLLESDHIER